MTRRLPRHYFVPVGAGARIYTRNASLHLTPVQFADLIEWIVAGRPDPMPERRRMAAELAAERAAGRGEHVEEVAE